MKGLPKIVWEPLVRQALVEDLGRAGDITTEATVSEDALAQGRIVARKPGRIAGLHLAIETFLMLDPQIKIDVLQCDGTDVEAGACLAQIEGLARPILTAERTALNFLGHLSGVATATAVVCQLLDGLDTQVTCTRKTTPGLRAMEKYAVRMGGGSNHRFGLDDGILIKDNHIVAAGSLSKAVSRARSSIGHMVKIEVEVDTLDQLSEALTYDIDVVLLDNMTLETLGEAVRLIDNRVISEASGDVTMDNARSIAETGVDVVSMGWITHSAPSLNVSLELENS
jgi:nicotinate-nucleotide pyrophosphorylase (carboxylating)